MYAVIELNGSQVKVEKNTVFRVNRIKDAENKTIKVDKVLFARKGSDCMIGEPYVKDAFVECEILGEKRAKKVIAFKYRDRKSSQSKTGHRQDLSELRVNDIVLDKTKKVSSTAEKAEKPAKKVSAKKQSRGTGKAKAGKEEKNTDKK